MSYWFKFKVLLHGLGLRNLSGTDRCKLVMYRSRQSITTAWAATTRLAKTMRRAIPKVRVYFK